jgi:hypothetical protein
MQPASALHSWTSSARTGPSIQRSRSSVEIDGSIVEALQRPRTANNSEKKVGPSDFQAEVDRLKVAGKFPSLDEVLDALVDARKKYAPKILEAREQGSPHR